MNNKPKQTLRRDPTPLSQKQNNSGDLSAYPARTKIEGDSMNREFLQKIKKYKKQKQNLFSYTEKICAALMMPDLYYELMPEKYVNDPIGAFCMVLDADQRREIIRHHVGMLPGGFI